MTPHKGPANMRAPFVLLDDARASQAGPGKAAMARYYSAPTQVLRAPDLAAMPDFLAAIDARRTEGKHLAGYFDYEAGFAFEPSLANLYQAQPSFNSEQPHGQQPPGQNPYGWFGVFNGYQEICGYDVPALLTTLADPAPTATPVLAPFKPAITQAQYLQKFDQVHQAIKAGDIYQANLTFNLTADFSGDPVALYLALRQQSAMGYGALLFDGTFWIASFSPELFFTLKKGVIATRPMKGTAPRHNDPAIDRQYADALGASAKDRAENLMIVDLLRNDLARISRPGSVQVPRLFSVESYPTLHQMTSQIRANLNGNIAASDIIKAIFPCGSITGAPKIRAMELLHAIEGDRRGVYCGAIGRFDPDIGDQPGDAAFNVAIRTLQFGRQRGKVQLGLGSGIVADSNGPSEWQECVLKGSFVEQLTRRFDLIETMAFDPESGLLRLELHLQRLKASASELGFEFDRHATRNALNAACFTLETPSKVRLLLSPSGATAIEMREMPVCPALPLKLMVVPLPVHADDFRLRHKTTDRAFYDKARRQAAADHHADEVIFQDEAGFLTEGSFTNLFIKAGDSLQTPAGPLGFLPGVLRAALLESEAAVEARLKSDDLKQADQRGDIMIGNSLRGLMAAKLITAKS